MYNTTIYLVMYKDPYDGTEYPKRIFDKLSTAHLYIAKHEHGNQMEVWCRGIHTDNPYDPCWNDGGIQEMSDEDIDILEFGHAISKDNEERKRRNREDLPPYFQMELKENWGIERYEKVADLYETRRMIECERNSLEYANDPQR